jgi:hypothetical protein
MPKPNPAFARPPSAASEHWSETGAAPARPLAVTVEEAARLLDIPLPMASRLARELQPYVHADGSYRWPLKELARALADCGGVRTRAELGA